MMNLLSHTLSPIGHMPAVMSDDPATMSLQPVDMADELTTRQIDHVTSPAAKWHVLWTRSHSEDMVYEQLQAKGFHLFLPKMDVWMRRNGNRYRSTVPMFPGYLFLHHAMEEEAYLELSKTRGLVKLLGHRWNQLAMVPDEEIEAVRRVVRSGVPAVPHPYLREGQRVRITRGLLAGIEGILRRMNTTKGLFVISINLLHRSVAVELDCSLLVAA